MLEFAHFDRRRYPTVSVREGYREWLPSYETTVEDEMDLVLLDALTRDEMQRLLVDVWAETRKTVLYVTHNVAEAVYLADRVIVLSPHPGTVVADVRVALPRPRDPLSLAFLEYQRTIVGHLGGRG